MRVLLYKQGLILFLMVFSLFNAQLNAQSVKWPVRKSTGKIGIIDFTQVNPTMGNIIPGFGTGGKKDLNIMTDPSGNILFITAVDSTDKIEIRDAFMNPMPNGNNLSGNKFTSESAICKMTCGSNKYFYFHYAGQQPDDSLLYTVIDLSQNGGLGSVSQKNVFVGSGFTQGMTISHQMRNGCRWLLIPGASGDTLLINAILISDLGIAAPIILDKIVMLDPVSSLKEIELSPDNTKLCISTATVSPSDPDIILYDFTLETGTVGNRKFYTVSNEKIAGIEFSPDASKIYYQTNTTTSNSLLGRIITTTAVNETIDSLLGPGLTYLEMAGNGKLYGCYADTFSYLSEIGDPDNPTTGNIQYNRKAIVIDSLGGVSALPNVIDGEPPGTSVPPTKVSFSAYLMSDCQGYRFVEKSCLGTWWEWDFGDGNTSGLQSPVHYYTAFGQYDVTLRILVCSDTVKIKYDAFITHTGIPINISASSVNCQGTPQQLTAGGADMYTWKPTTGLNVSSGSIVTASPAGITTYTVTGTNVSGCSGSANIVIDPSGNALHPTISLQSPMAICQGGSVTLTATGNGLTSFQWFKNHTKLQGATSPSFSATSGGHYAVAVTDANGCSDTASITVDATPGLNSIFSYTPVKCSKQAYFKNLSVGANAYTWIFNDNYITHEENPFYEFPTYGSFLVKLISTNGTCSDTLVRNITLNKDVRASFVCDSLCDLQKVFTNKSIQASNYFWDFGDGITDTSHSPVHHFSTQGIYQVSLIATDQNNCNDTIKKSIHVGEYSASDFYYQADTCKALFNFYAQSQSALAYQWNFGDSSFSTIVNPVHKYVNEGTYDVRLTTNPTLSCAESTHYTVTVDYIPINKLYIPNTFTPNGDGINDYFKIMGYDKCGAYELYIYNRWGTLIYQTNTVSEFWDGKRGGNYVEGGVYCYLLKGNGITRNGTVLVLF